MISQLTVIAHQIGERAFHLLCPPDAPLADVKLALCEFIKKVADIEEKVAAAQKEKAEQDAAGAPKVDEAKPEDKPQEPSDVQPAV